MRKSVFLSLLMALCLLPEARADEGMWLIQCLDKALEKNMKARGCKLGAREIYNEEAGGLSDAIVSFGFYCTGSMVSEEGLMITNHHCAYGDVADLSTAEHNYLEDGFWALSRDKEISIPDKEVFFLKKVLDVTDEVNALKEELKAKGQNFGSRRLSSIMESKYKKETGLEASLEAMWAGEKQYLCLYTRYTDVRLVAAPPVTIAAFGGDEDNWEWPQHKADFAIYRVYDDNGQPLKPSRRLKVSTQGYKEGSYAMVIGYPGRTSRYASAAEMNQVINVEHPASNRLRARQMEIMRKWMDADPAIRLKYSNNFFGLSNVAELQEGEEACMHRFKVIERRREWEKSMEKTPEYAALLKDLDQEFTSTSDIELQKVYYRETLVRSLIISRTLMRMGSAGEDLERQRKILADGLAETDPRVEKELLEFSLKEFFTHLDPKFFKPIHQQLQEQFGSDYAAMAAWLWDHSCVADSGKKPDAEVVAQYQGPSIASDPLYRYIRELGIQELNNCEQHVGNPLEMRRAYVRARYHTLKEQGVPQYPDANSTMRITYGNVCGMEAKDGLWYHWQSKALGLRQKYNPDNYDFTYPDAFKAVLPPDDYPVNFLTNLDITGGNSGSPVLNARGELIGLAFDGNKESLASTYEAVAGYNMCVCVDIRYVLWVLKEYGGLDYIYKEMLL